MTQWFMLALRNVLRNARRSAMLGCTIAVGAMALLMFISYIAASLYGLRESTIRGGLGHLQIATRGQFDGYAEQQLQFGLDRTELARVETLLGQQDGVRRLVPRLSFSGLLSNGPRTLNFQGDGVDPKSEQQAFGAFQNLVAGQRLSNAESGRYQVLLGVEMARRLAVKPGDSVTMLTTTVNGSINAIDLEVCGLISTGIPASDLYLLQLPLATAQEVLRTTKISYLSVLLDDSAALPATAASLRRQLGMHQEMKTWEELAPLYTQVLALYRNQFLVFGAIIGIVVFLGVSTMTLTTIYERAREIGTLRAMGISSAAIRRLFVYEGLIQGVSGAVSGAAAAWVLIVLVNLAHIELAPPPGRNVGVALNLLWVPAYALPIIAALPLLAMLASWLVSRRIGGMAIVDSISSH
ncbi:putative ABC transport system permease protein [Oxalobacteraceae bacterium GrIS 1.11]